jgi:primosomal replication protein N
MGPAAPIKDAAQEFSSFLDNPAYYAGEKGADAGFTAPSLMFGGEGAAVRAGLGEIGPGVLDTGPAVSTEAAIGFEHPMGYNPWAEDAAYDVNYGHWHGGPTGALSESVADMSTHYIGDNPDRVVLGKFHPEGGYIGEARGHGGIYFDTGDPTWDALTQGFATGEEKSLVWQVNESFLRNQMESGVPRIEYVLPDGYDSVEQLAGAQRQSYSAMEINFLKDHAASYGYEQQGNVWVCAGGK